MNWNAKDTSEIAINKIFTEHVEKESKLQQPKTIVRAPPSAQNALTSRSIRPHCHNDVHEARFALAASLAELYGCTARSTRPIRAPLSS